MPTELAIHDQVGAWAVWDCIEDTLQDAGFTELDITQIRIAVEAAITNALIRGNQNDPAKRVSVVFGVTAERLDITITDEGEGLYVEEPDPYPYGFAAEPPCAREILLMRAFMTEVQFHTHGNMVCMSKVRNAGA